MFCLRVALALSVFTFCPRNGALAIGIVIFCLEIEHWRGTSSQLVSKTSSRVERPPSQSKLSRGKLSLFVSKSRSRVIFLLSFWVSWLAVIFLFSEILFLASWLFGFSASFLTQLSSLALGFLVSWLFGFLFFRLFGFLASSLT